VSDEREQVIRERAYAIWKQAGRPDGQSLAHWLEAEAEIGPEKIVGFTNHGKPVTASQVWATERSLAR
jgi:hypothetical protein